MLEMWKWVKGYEGLYMISNFGRLKSFYKEEKILKAQVTNDGYEILALTKNHITKRTGAHRLVCQAFVDNPHNFPEVNHIDENKRNNRVDNLEWCTREYNDNFGTGKARNIQSNRLKNGRSIYVICKDGTDYFFESVREACLELNLDRGALFACLRGDQNTQKGYRFEDAVN